MIGLGLRQSDNLLGVGDYVVHQGALGTGVRHWEVGAPRQREVDDDFSEIGKAASTDSEVGAPRQRGVDDESVRWMRPSEKKWMRKEFSEGDSQFTLTQGPHVT